MVPHLHDHSLLLTLDLVLLLGLLLLLPLHLELLLPGTATTPPRKQDPRTEHDRRHSEHRLRHEGQMPVGSDAEADPHAER